MQSALNMAVLALTLALAPVLVLVLVLLQPDMSGAGVCEHVKALGPRTYSSCPRARLAHAFAAGRHAAGRKHVPCSSSKYLHGL